MVVALVLAILYKIINSMDESMTTHEWKSAELDMAMQMLQAVQVFTCVSFFSSVFFTNKMFTHTRMVLFLFILGGGWHANDDDTSTVDGASLLEGGSRGGEACYATDDIGIHGQGGFGGGGGGCKTGGINHKYFTVSNYYYDGHTFICIAYFFVCLLGGGGGYAGGDTYKSVMNGDGGTSYIGSKRSIADLSFIYGGDNIGHGLVVIVPALSHPACGCDYRCVVLDEFSVNVRCICPDGWRLKKDNQTACERKRFYFYKKLHETQIKFFKRIIMLIRFVFSLFLSFFFIFIQQQLFHRKFQWNI